MPFPRVAAKTAMTIASAATPEAAKATEIQSVFRSSAVRRRRDSTRR
jgi:hypothetical protein